MKIIYFALMLTLFGVSSQQLEAGNFLGKLKPAGCHESASCTPCQLVCTPEVKRKTVTKDCWDVDCEPICIPSVRCPLFDFFRKDDSDPCAAGVFKGKSLGGRSGKVRMVKKLKKVEYECEECRVEWKVRCVSPYCGKPSRRCDVSDACHRIE